MRKIAIIGSGAMSLYLLKHLTENAEPLEICIYEASEIAGVGTPYRPDMNADYMLCNAFSREIPAITQPLINWLKDQPKSDLNEWELGYHDLHSRAFYPRVLIGEYLQSEFDELYRKATGKGHRIKVHTQTPVTDVVPDQSGVTVKYGTGKLGTGKHGNGANPGQSHFDDVVIATGHRFPRTPSIDDVGLVSPWPYTNLLGLQAREIGILGSSLSAIDIVIALGHDHGVFDEQADGIRWLPNDDSQQLRISMVSHMGIMPEGDFYYPFPYGPLQHLTEETVAAEIAKGPEQLLDRVFDLLCAELDAADPDYLGAMPADARTVDGFADSYFAKRQEFGGLRAVKNDLAQTRESVRRRETIPYRYALLRGHEKFDAALRHLPDEEYDRFLDRLMPVFADCYAAVPHLSLARIVAMYEAGILELAATGPSSRFRQLDDGSIAVETQDGELVFDLMIDARGQSAAGISALPFGGLNEVLADPDKDLVEPFELNVASPSQGRIFCLAIPQVLERYPFSQGLAECWKLSRVVADRILEDPPKEAQPA